MSARILVVDDIAANVKVLEVTAAIDVGKAIYAKIDFLSRVDLNMYVQDCYARPSQGRSAYQYDLIEENG